MAKRRLRPIEGHEHVVRPALAPAESRYRAGSQTRPPPVRPAGQSFPEWRGIPERSTNWRRSRKPSCPRNSNRLRPSSPDSIAFMADSFDSKRPGLDISRAAAPEDPESASATCGDTGSGDAGGGSAAWLCGSVMGSAGTPGGGPSGGLSDSPQLRLAAALGGSRRSALDLDRVGLGMNFDCTGSRVMRSRGKGTRGLGRGRSPRLKGSAIM